MKFKRYLKNTLLGSGLLLSTMAEAKSDILSVADTSKDIQSHAVTSQDALKNGNKLMIVTLASGDDKKDRMAVGIKALGGVVKLKKLKKDPSSVFGWEVPKEEDIVVEDTSIAVGIINDSLTAEQAEEVILGTIKEHVIKYGTMDELLICGHGVTDTLFIGLPDDNKKIGVTGLLEKILLLQNELQTPVSRNYLWSGCNMAANLDDKQVETFKKLSDKGHLNAAIRLSTVNTASDLRFLNGLTGSFVRFANGDVSRDSLTNVLEYKDAGGDFEELVQHEKWFDKSQSYDGLLDQALDMAEKEESAVDRMMKEMIENKSATGSGVNAPQTPTGNEMKKRL